MRKTKIVCTLGPASSDEETIKKMILAGMNVARLNFSHGNYEEKLEKIRIVRSLSEKLNIPVAILSDLQGPKLRLGEFDGKRNLKKGEVVTLALSPVEDKQSLRSVDLELPIQYDLTPYIKKNQRILLNDGLVETKVVSVGNKRIKVRVENDGWVSSNKGVNVPDTYLKNSAFTDKDRDDLEFALENNVDYVALSFIQTVDDIKPVKEILKKRKSQAKLIIKVEKARAIEELESIIEASGGIMVARGDLAVETNPAQVPLYQKRAIRLCREYFKPVIIATQMLESMTENPRPTRAEVSDVANAVFDSVDGVMLSAESATGKYPVEVVSMMREVIDSVEGQDEYINHIGVSGAQVSTAELSSRAVASSAVVLSELTEAKLIVAGTHTGRTVQSLSTFRPDCSIVGLASEEIVRNQMVLFWGVQPYLIRDNLTPEAFWKRALEIIRDGKLASKGEKVIILSGPVVGGGGTTDTLKIETV